MDREEILAMEAEEADPILIAIEVMNWHRGSRWGAKCWEDEQGNFTALIGWDPWMDLLAAFQVVGKMFELGYAMSLLHLGSEFYPEYWYCDFRSKDSNGPPEYKWVDHQKTASVAICKAALLGKLEVKR